MTADPFRQINLGDDYPDPDIDLDAFCSSEEIGSDEEESRYIRPVFKSINPRHIVYENAERLAREIAMDKGVRYDVIVPGNFIFGDFIEAFLVHNNAGCVRMDICTLSMSENNIDSLHNLMVKDYIGQLNLTLSAYFYAHERFRLIQYIYQELDIDDRFQLAVAGIHTKICTFETEGGKKIIIHGSANLRSSSNIEQFTIEENPELYDFYTDFNDRITEQYKTILKKKGPAANFKLINRVKNHE